VVRDTVSKMITDLDGLIAGVAVEYYKNTATRTLS